MTQTKGAAKRGGNTKTQQSIEHKNRSKTRGDKGKNKKTRKLQKSKACKTKTRKWGPELNCTSVSSGSETRKNKNNQLKLGVRGIALDKGKGNARQSWQNKRLSKTIKQNKNAGAKIKGAESTTQSHCSRGEGRTY